jgi:hypothetical protein
MTAETLAGAKGTEHSRTPIALNTALPLAAGTIAAVGSGRRYAAASVAPKRLLRQIHRGYIAAAYSKIVKYQA